MHLQLFSRSQLRLHGAKYAKGPEDFSSKGKRGLSSVISNNPGDCTLLWSLTGPSILKSHLP